VNLNGLWTANFSSATGMTGSGVVVLMDGRVLGGDANYHYVGTYTIDESRFHAEIQVTHYFGPLTNIFGPFRSIKLVLDGATSEQLIMAQGYVVSAQALRMSLRLQRVAGLAAQEKK